MRITALREQIWIVCWAFLRLHSAGGVRILTLKFHIHFQPSTMIPWMVLFEVKRRSSLTVARYRMVWGHLKGRRLVIQQSRVRGSRCGELNALRWLHVTERRKYKVASPNALLAYWWTSQTQKVCFPSLCISRVYSHLCLFSYPLSDCWCWQLNWKRPVKEAMKMKC